MGGVSVRSVPQGMCLLDFCSSGATGLLHFGHHLNTFDSDFIISPILKQKYTALSAVLLQLLYHKKRLALVFEIWALDIIRT